MTRARGRIAASALILAFAATICHGATVPQTAADRKYADFVARSTEIYTVQPDIANCRAGKLTDAEKTRALDALNAIRSLHGLSPVTYDTRFDDAIMQAALMLAANQELNHNPPASWKCYTTDGARMAGLSNIEGGLASPYLLYTSAEDNIIGWLTDVRNQGAGIGHRRWLLDPFLRTIAFGKVSGAFDAQSVTEASLVKVIGDGARTTALPTDASVSATKPRIIAYPQGDYPVRYYEDGAQLSVSLLTNLSESYENKADFSRATIRIRERGGDDLPASDVHSDNLFYGVPNSLRISTSALKRGVIYDVSLTNVRIAGHSVDVSYWFRLVP